MPFGLTGAPSSFQRIIITFINGYSLSPPMLMMYWCTQLPCKITATTYNKVFKKLQAAELMLKGKMSKIAMSEVQYLGQVFSQAGRSQMNRRLKLFKIGQLLLQLRRYVDILA